MEQIEIRKYKSEDYFKICEIDKPLFQGMGGHILFRHIEELFPSFFFVAEEVNTNKIVGYLLGGIHSDDKTTAKLIRIGVANGYQRIGCGAGLTSALFSELKKNGVKKIHLTVAEDNFPAISFYKKIGFEQKKRVEKYFYPDVPRLIFEKDI